MSSRCPLSCKISDKEPKVYWCCRCSQEQPSKSGILSSQETISLDCKLAHQSTVSHHITPQSAMPNKCKSAYTESARVLVQDFFAFCKRYSCKESQPFLCSRMLGSCTSSWRKPRFPSIQYQLQLRPLIVSKRKLQIGSVTNLKIPPENRGYIKDYKGFWMQFLRGNKKISGPNQRMLAQADPKSVKHAGF